jgi:hypothetical protein
MALSALAEVEMATVVVMAAAAVVATAVELVQVAVQLFVELMVVALFRITLS